MRRRRLHGYCGSISRISFRCRCFRSPPLDGREQIGAEPVAFYAAVFFLVNVTYVVWSGSSLDRTHDVEPRVRRIMRFRSITTSCLFGMAAVVALKYPLVGLGICIGCLICLSSARSAGSGATKISFGFKVKAASAFPGEADMAGTCQNIRL